MYGDEDSPKIAAAGYEMSGLGRNSIQARTKLERLSDMKRGLEAKLAEVDKAILLLKGNPQINEIIEALERAGV